MYLLTAQDSVNQGLLRFANKNCITPGSLLNLEYRYPWNCAPSVNSTYSIKVKMKAGTRDLGGPNQGLEIQCDHGVISDKKTSPDVEVFLYNSSVFQRTESPLQGKLGNK